MTITQRIDAITAIGEDYLSQTPPIPKSVKIELTARCDFKCFFCASHQRLRDKHDMPLSMFTRLVNEMVALGVKEIGVFYLGESFILKNLADYIKAAKDAGAEYVFLTTNGLKANPARLREVMEAGLDSLKFSINYSDAKQFEEVTGMPSRLYGTVIDHLKAATAVRQEVGSKCGIYASSILYDGDQQSQMQRLVEEILPYIDEHYYLPLYNQGALTTDVSQEHGYKPTAGNQGRIGALRDPLPCWSAFTEGHVTYDGGLSACCFDHSEDWRMGDLNHQGFAEAWNSKKFQDLRAAHIRKDVTGTPCEFCVAWQ